MLNPNLNAIVMNTDLITANIPTELSSFTQFNRSINALTVALDGYFALNDTVNNGFNIDQMLNYINGIFPGDTVETTILFCSLRNIIVSELGSGDDATELMIPGFYDHSFSSPYDQFDFWLDDPDRNYYFYLYNMTEDPDETTNLLEKYYPKNRITPQVRELCSIINNSLNDEIVEQNLVNFKFVLPKKLFLAVAYNLHVYGTDLANYSSIATKSMSTACGMGNADEPSTNNYFDVMQSIVMNLNNQ